MIKRPKGVAHVNIMWFIVMVVLFLGGVGFAYIQMQEVKRLEGVVADLNKQLADSENKRLAQYNLCLEISKPVGFRGESEGSMTQPELVKQKVKELREIVKGGPSDDTLQKVIPKVMNLVAAQKRRIQELEIALASAEKARDEARNTLREVTAKKDNELDQLRAEKSDAESNLRSQIQSKENDNADLRSQVRKKNEELAQKKEKWAKEKKKLMADISQLALRNEKAAEKLKIIENPDKIDGKIISVSDKIARAWINLGRKHMVKPGMNFEILELRGNQYVHKAWAKVLTVEEESSEVAITGLVDKFNPVAKGDFIKNKLYDPDVRFNFVLIGRFVEPLTKGEIKRILEDMGNKVMDEVTPETDYVIMGKQPIGEDATPIEQTKDYLKAVKLRINILPLKRIRSFLKL